MPTDADRTPDVSDLQERTVEGSLAYIADRLHDAGLPGIQAAVLDVLRRLRGEDG